MADRIRHDADGVSTYDGVVRPEGRTGRYNLRFPIDAELPVESVIRVIMAGSEYRTKPRHSVREGGVEVRGVYDSARQAREENPQQSHLTSWIEEHGLGSGRTVHLDVIVEEFKYGLRGPGEEAVYSTRGPKSSLRNIAEDL